MSHGDIKYGSHPFPYGDLYDRGISLNRVVGVAADPLGLTEGAVYVKMTLHKNYAEYAVNSPVNAERTIYIKAELLGDAESLGTPIVTIRLGEAFQSTSGSYITGQVAGVVSSLGLVGLFSWRTSNGMLEWFPDSAMTVFDEPITPAVINGTSWGGASAYEAAVNGAPLYYFLWDAVNIKLNGPVRRVLPEEVPTVTNTSDSRAFGVFVPLNELGEAGTPLPAIIRPTNSLLEMCLGYISEGPEVELRSSEDSSVKIGSAAFTDVASWGPYWATRSRSIKNWSTGPSTLGDTFDYTNEFDTAVFGNTSGYFFYGWYDTELDLDDPSQNANRVFLIGAEELGLVYLLPNILTFAGGTTAAPNELFLNLSPVAGASPSLTAVITFSLDLEPLELDGSASALLSSAYTEGTKVFCSGQFHTALAISFIPAKDLKYHPLADGSEDGQILKWDNTLGEWRAGTATGGTGSVGDGDTNGQILVWSAGASAWVPGAYGATADQVLRWSGSGWTAGANTAMPTGADKSTIFFDGPGGTGAWTHNPILQWDKYVNSGSASTGGDLILDLTACAARPWNLPMPGIVMRHPAGGTCGLFANIESGENAGPRMDMGWGGAFGANFELYSNAHGTRPGEFRIIYGPTGHIAFTNFRGGSDWEVTAGLTKEGRFFCGFNDTGFPGGADTIGTYPVPAYPFQVYNEASHESKIVSGITKEGRGFFGLGGTMPTAGVEHPVEVYNESSTPSRVVYISKAGKIETRAVVSGSTHVARLDCADVAFTTGATAQAIQLREMIMPYPSGGAVKGKLTQVLCGAGYGEELSLGGTPTAPASPTQLLPTSTPTEAAYNDTWAAATLGVTISLETRSAYFDTSDKKVYGYKRLFTYTKEGALFSVGAEQRYEIFVPVTIQWPT